MQKKENHLLRQMADSVVKEVERSEIPTGAPGGDGGG